ncbi:Superfamily I DNA and RNA helicase [Hahella chejuensis KCTC 2396]|uniref:DNA 3'-5' helicase n=1 Tax=Hahella chejuensis (strain KCTC 2396) TaxID=349521 RepID=Q2SNY3_HAHCH|nr:DNA helicase II [Hahella chejuensis]ABC27641.1 Superfamily I DNA and RNA helicase [Hahella chejuensis KCTC 2396]
MDVTAVLDPLNDAQREAVTASARNLLVLAGAGSGKTRVLVHRMAWLIQVERIGAHAIMAVTFTNKAAREMRERVESLLHIPTRGMWLGTFHSLAHRLLRAHWREAGLPENFQVIDSDDQQRMLKRVIRELGLDESKWPARQAQYFINSQKDEGLRPDNIEPGSDAWRQTMNKIYQRYDEYCRQSGLVDFGELLLRSHELWLQKPDLLRHYQQRFQHILVDEFQDTNTIQYAWLRVLAGDRVPMTVVGDDDQSIYGWRGAKIENIQRFQNDFGEAALVRLEQNYRSTQTILRAANHVIAHNPSRLGKQLWTDQGEGEAIDVYAAFNEQDEANYIVESVQSWVNQGRSRSEVALLYRSNVQSRVLEEALIRHGVPYRIYGGLRFYDRLEVKNAVAYLRLAHFADDDAAFERVVNIPSRGVGAKSLETLRDAARERRGSLWRTSVAAVSAGLIKGKAGAGLKHFIEIVENLREFAKENSLQDLTKHMLEVSGILEHHANEKGDKAEARKENLLELVNAVAEYETLDNESPLAEFLTQAALDAGERQAEVDQDAVQLMTLHSAKGLEFPLVFLTGMEEELFPHSMALEEAGRLEEERRLCYVGITRAMEKLVLTFAESRRLYGQDKYHSISRFVREIPNELLREVRLRSVVSKPMFWDRGPAHGAIGESAQQSGISLGQRVRHEKFGEGVVLNYEGSGPHSRIQVNFDDQGSKWLVLSYAKLEAI